MNPEIVKIEITIADLRIPIRTEVDKLKDVREIEAKVDGLYKSWRRKFPNKSEKELLAMIAYQYASYYQELSARYQEASELALECDRRLDKISKSSPEG